MKQVSPEMEFKVFFFLFVFFLKWGSCLKGCRQFQFRGAGDSVAEGFPGHPRETPAPTSLPLGKFRELGRLVAQREANSHPLGLEML